MKNQLTKIKQRQHEQYMNNKTKQSPKIYIQSRLVYNPKKQDNS